ncbi:glycosyltransferase family 4 protein [Cupriavidus laharis]|uniref:glycosyltransferase family 4 protein n=1 Tax=Cupriavidus laharis TaxID=151654 RepID=UPI001CC6AAB9|nr:glycosyltransferase family 1 protein [Cupriavidus laharis]
MGLSTGTLYGGGHGGKLDGIGVYTAALARTLPRSGCSLTQCVYRGPVHGAGFPHGIVAFPRPFAQQALASAFGATLRVTEHIDIYHATDYRVVRMDCPVVATLHDAVPLRFPEWTSPRLRRLKNWQIRQAGRTADHVIAHSRASVADLVQYFNIDEGSISVVPCGVDRYWLVPPEAGVTESVLSRYKLRSGYFLFVGTLQPRKNLGTLLNAYLSLPERIRHEQQLVIVGRAGWRCDADVAAILAAQRAGERVVWLADMASEDELRSIYVGASAFIFPSLYEGFGLPLLEAFASGTPVICSDISCLPEVAGGAAVEVDPLDPEAIATAMALLLEDSTLREKCITLGKERAALLSWERTASATLDVYRTLV